MSGTLAVWTQIVLWFTAASFVIDMFTVATLRGAADRFYKAFGTQVDPTRTDLGNKWIDSEGTADLSWVLTVLLCIATVVLLIVWAHHVTRATGRHRAPDRKWTPGWAVGGWFIPLANFVLPALVLMEDKRISVAAARGDVSQWRSVRRSILVGLWFFSWAVGVGLCIAGVDMLGATDYFPLESRTTVMVEGSLLIAGCIVSAAAACLAAVCVLLITNADHRVPAPESEIARR